LEDREIMENMATNIRQANSNINLRSQSVEPYKRKKAVKAPARDQAEATHLKNYNYFGSQN